MHIPDGYLSPQTAGGMWALMIPAWYWAGHKVNSSLNARQAPLVAIGAAFTFVIMMFNVPLPGGTTGHAVGGTIVAIVIGPWAVVISVSVALVIQAVFFGDGGILAIGANCFNIGFVLPVSGYYVYRLLAGRAAPESPRRWLAAGIGSFVGLNAAAFFAAVEFGLQGELFTAADGSALYAPYGLSTAIPAMLVPHLLVVGLIEGVMTSLVYIFLMRTNTSLLDNYTGIKAATAGDFRLKPLIIGIVLLLVCAPLGLLATGTAWGEWGKDEVGEKIGYVPEGMERLSGFWSGILPDYALPEKEEASAAKTGGGPDQAVSADGVQDSAPAYYVSGALGLLLAGGVALMVVRLIAGNSRGKKQLG